MSSFRAYADQGNGQLIDFAAGCLFDDGATADLFGAKFSLSDFNPAGPSFRASLIDSGQTVTMYGSDETIFDWIPSNAIRCGTKQ